MKCIKIEEHLFQDMVKFYIENFALSPLSAKIYSYLFFDFYKKGVTFEQLVEDLNASKSSVSTNIKLLLGAGLIADVNKLDERKRYFIINELHFQNKFKKVLQKLQTEKKLLDRLELFAEENTEQMCAETLILKSNRSKRYRKLIEKIAKEIEENVNEL